MPDDVPLEEPPRRLSHGGLGRVITPAEPHMWESLRIWEILLVVATLVPATLILLGDLPVRDRVIVAGCLVSILLLYVVLGRPAIVAENQRRGTVYLVLLALLFVPATFITPDATFALFGLCPQCFMVFPSKRAMIGVVVLNLAPTIRYLFLGPELGWLGFLTIATIVIFFSWVFGIWMEGMSQQNRERAELIEELMSSRAEVSRLSAERGALTERERLAGEIHDTLAQGFTSIIMLVQAAQAQADPARHLALAVQTARENLAEARALVAALSPAPLDGSSLDEALVRLADRLTEETGIAGAFAVRGESRPLPPHIEVVLIRAAQEALANVRKHAAANRVDVSVTYGPRRVTLEIGDNGRGFDPSRAGGYGLRGMRNRVEQAGGSMRVWSSPARGTTLTVDMGE
ncbi:sensor histidine kinase [Streptosporangium lutulentum]